jgi:hypothetical protein
MTCAPEGVTSPPSVSYILGTLETSDASRPNAAFRATNSPGYTGSLQAMPATFAVASVGQEWNKMSGHHIDYSSPEHRLRSLKVSRRMLAERRSQTIARLDKEERDADEQIAELEKLVREQADKPNEA